MGINWGALIRVSDACGTGWLSFLFQLRMHAQTHTHKHTHSAMPADTSITDKAAVAQQVINRRGKVVESYNEDTLVS